MGDLSWSATRARTLQECRRKYYYRYHLAPLARRPDAPPAALQADRLKDLVGLEAWAGDLVHRVIEETLNRWRAGRDVLPSEIERRAAQLLSRQFRHSREYWTAHPDEFPRRPVLLDLHYYAEGEVSRERAAALKAQVLGALRAFLDSHLARRIREVGPARWLPVDRNAAARLSDDLLIRVKPDFAFREGERLVILDWKTGRPDPFWELVQVAAYALYAVEKWGGALDRIAPRLVYLQPEFRLSDAGFDAESIRDVLLFIRESFDEMSALAEGEGPPPIERFEWTEEGHRCRWCAFRGICDGARRSS